MIRSAAPNAPPLPFARVEVFTTLAPLEGRWRVFESEANATLYQTYNWVSAWMETMGRRAYVTPFIVRASNERDETTALLPLLLCTSGFINKVMFAGAKDSNLNIGLFREPALWDESAIRALLLQTAVMSPTLPDVFLLLNQPKIWRDQKNPLHVLTHSASPSFAYGNTLANSGEDFLANNLSKERRKKLRHKASRLKSMGDVEMVRAGNGEQARVIITACIAQKEKRFEFSPKRSEMLIQFLERGFDQGAVEVYALYLNQRIIATYIGGAHNGHFSIMMNSFEQDEQVAKSSPGELLLKELVQHLCSLNLTSFDLGIGEASYKQIYCKQTIPLFDVAMPLNAKGHAFGAAFMKGLKLKHHIKSNPTLNAYAQKFLTLVR